MKRYSIFCIAAAVVLGAPAAASGSATITLQDDNRFSPESAALDLGDGSFDWQWGPAGAGTLDRHNVVQGNGSAKPLFDSGETVREMPGGFSVTASAGTFPYYCEIHLGMIGEVAVRPVGEAKGKGVRLSWASADTTTGNRFDVRYKAGKKWKSWKKKIKKTAGTFGRKGKPVKLGKKAVKVQARSRAGKARSDWSPTLKLAR
ncbi:MAG TPA: hypothetical protein VK920_11630 [Solirubrobacterales bacterium]|nr:hypothetical protein [Solirubrobacterales bacterium]